MIQPFKDRTLKPSARVDVYRNLQNGLWSVRGYYAPRAGGRSQRGVVAHADHIVLSSCSLWVGAAGRDRVRATGRREVHACVEGKYDAVLSGATELVPDLDNEVDPWQEITYDPHVSDWFTRVADGAEVRWASRVVFTPEMRVYAQGTGLKGGRTPAYMSL